MVRIFEPDAKISDAKLREIGRIIAHWSLLEHLVGSGIQKIAGLDKKSGRAITNRLNIRAKLDALALVADINNLAKRQRDQMNKLIEKIKNEQRHRNDVAHGLWGIDEGRWFLIRFKSPTQVKLGRSTRMTANELRRIANRIDTLTRAFNTWINNLDSN